VNLFFKGSLSVVEGMGEGGEGGGVMCLGEREVIEGLVEIGLEG